MENQNSISPGFAHRREPGRSGIRLYSRLITMRDVTLATRKHRISVSGQYGVKKSHDAPHHRLRRPRTVGRTDLLTRLFCPMKLNQARWELDWTCVTYEIKIKTGSSAICGRGRFTGQLACLLSREPELKYQASTAQQRIMFPGAFGELSRRQQMYFPDDGTNHLWLVGNTISNVTSQSGAAPHQQPSATHQRTVFERQGFLGHYV